MQWVKYGRVWRNPTSLALELSRKNKLYKAQLQERKEAKLVHDASILINRDYARVSVPYSLKDQFKQYLKENRLYGVWDPSTKEWALKIEKDNLMVPKMLNNFRLYTELKAWLIKFGLKITVKTEKLQLFEEIRNKLGIPSIRWQSDNQWLIDYDREEIMGLKL